MAAHTSHAEDVPRTAGRGSLSCRHLHTAIHSQCDRTAAGKFDFQCRQDGTRQARRREPPVTTRRTGRMRVSTSRGAAVCLPSGFPLWHALYPTHSNRAESKYVVIIPELQRAARIIPTDGRRTVKGSSPRYYGDSVGKMGSRHPGH